MMEENMNLMILQSFESSRESHENSPPYTLQRKTKLLNERIRPSWTWPMAYCPTRNCPINIGPRQLHILFICLRDLQLSVKDMVPEEAWSGTKIHVAHLRFFGSIAFSHVPTELRKNLDNISEKCIFTGYSEKYKSYKLYNPIVIANFDTLVLISSWWHESQFLPWTFSCWTTKLTRKLLKKLFWAGICSFCSC